MINQGQKFSEELLKLCLAPVEERVFKVNLARNLNFSHKVAPCRLVVPFQAMLIPSLPSSHDSEYLKGFRPFPRDPTTIDGMFGNSTLCARGSTNFLFFFFFFFQLSLMKRRSSTRLSNRARSAFEGQTGRYTMRCANPRMICARTNV